MKKILLFLDRLDEYIAVFTLSTTVLLLAFQVISRYIFNLPIAWAEEISRFTFVWAVYMGVSMAARKNEHIRVVAHLKLFFPRSISNAIILVGDIITLIFSAVLAVYGIQVLLSMVEYPYIAPATGISMVWIYTIIPIAFLSLFIRTIQVFILKNKTRTWADQDEVSL
jgi:TRAP-type C4-dicarboxylate transport system permease small subunit